MAVNLKYVWDVNNRILDYACVDYCIKQFDDEESIKEKAVDFVFSKSSDLELDHILARVSILNLFYSAGLNTYEPSKEGKHAIDIVNMAKRIHSKREQLNELFSQVRNNPCCSDSRFKAVNLIACDNEEGNAPLLFNRAFSFASKYCSWINQDRFPILDSYSKLMLKELNNSIGFYKGKIGNIDNNYYQFCRLFEAFKQVLESRALKEYSTKDIDKFLWYYGKYHQTTEFEEGLNAYKENSKK